MGWKMITLSIVPVHKGVKHYQITFGGLFTDEKIIYGRWENRCTTCGSKLTADLGGKKSFDLHQQFVSIFLFPLFVIQWTLVFTVYLWVKDLSPVRSLYRKFHFKKLVAWLGPLWAVLKQVAEFKCKTCDNTVNYDLWQAKICLISIGCIAFYKTAVQNY